MIDKSRMNRIIDIAPEAFRSSQWRCRIITRNGRSNTIYTHIDNGVYYLYSQNSHRLTISGRLTLLSEIGNRVHNLDELYQGASGVKIKQAHGTTDEGERTVTYYLDSYSQNLEDIIIYVNGRLRDLLNIAIDIGTFRLTYLEICFNVPTEYVGAYIKLFNMIFLKKNPKRYKNFVIEMKRPTDSSFYIKGKTQFEKKYATGYVVNFYNKLNQLQGLLKESIEKYYKREDAAIPFQLEDIIKARNVLRLEVQCYYNMLSRMSSDCRFDIHDREFREFINLGLCRNIIVGRYEYLIGNGDCDFYSYAAACKAIEESDFGKVRKANLLKYILDTMLSHENKYNEKEIEYYRKLLRQLNIHWCFIPTKWGIDKMESPVKLLDKWIGQVKYNREKMDMRAQIAQLEAEYYNEQLNEPEEEIDIIVPINEDSNNE